VKDVAAGEHFSAHRAAAGWTVAKPHFLAQVNAGAGAAIRRERPKPVGRRLLPAAADFADLRRDEVAGRVHLRVRAKEHSAVAFDRSTRPTIGYTHHGLTRSVSTNFSPHPCRNRQRSR
jgi:hypothetical protein